MANTPTVPHRNAKAKLNQSAGDEARNRGIEAGQGSNDEHSAGFSGLELANAQAQFGFFQGRTSFHRIG